MFPGPVCVVLTPRRVEDLPSFDVSQADCVEVRLDYLEDPGSAADVRWGDMPVPVIATCRRTEFGGMFDGTPGEEIRLLERAVRNGARYVDLDYRIAAEVGDADVIASFHDFAGTPRDLDRVMQDVCNSHGAIGKVAVMTLSWADVARLVEVGEREWPKPTVAIGMGMCGQMTRVIGPSRGSELTYVSSGEESAPGQLSVRELLDTFRFRSIRRATRLLGIVGNPVGHSASPALHNRALEAAGLDYVYLRLPVESLEDFFQHADALGVVGFSVTIPHKVDVVRFLDRLTPEAEAVGAVNTVSRQGGRWVGDNTDVHGVRAALRDLDLDGMRVVVLGTGGAARAAVAALEGARSVTLLSRTMTPGPVAWARNVEVDRLDRYDAHDADLLINATPVGMSPNAGRAPVEGRIRAGVVFDMIYNPEETVLLRNAREQGKRTISGRVMFMAQAGRQFEIWTGERADPDIFRGVA